MSVHSIKKIDAKRLRRRTTVTLAVENVTNTFSRSELILSKKDEINVAVIPFTVVRTYSINKLSQVGCVTQRNLV